jgi:hypothetical protein
MLIGSVRSFGVVAAFAISAIPAWAVLTGCGGQTIVDLPPGNFPSQGCGQQDLGFASFSNSGDGTTLTGSGGAITGGDTIAPIFLEFGGPPWQSSIARGDGNLTFSFQDVSEILGPAEQGMAPTDGSWYVSGLALTMAGGVDNIPGSFVRVQEEFCLGATSFNCATSSSNYGYLEEEFMYIAGPTPQTIFTVCTPGPTGCTTSNPGSASIAFANPGYQTIGVQNDVFMGTPPSDTSTLISFTEEFDQENTIPEPSTLVLLGAGLITTMACREHVARASRRATSTFVSTPGKSTTLYRAATAGSDHNECFRNSTNSPPASPPNR